MENLKKIIQSNILDLMSQSNISMRQLSADINCSESYIQKILSGDFTPKLERLLDIANYFNVPIWMLFLSPDTVPDKATQIHAYVLKLDEDSMDATLNIVKRLPAKTENK